MIRTARTLTTIYLAVAVALSFTHIAALFLHLGAGWQSWIAPVLTDTVIVIGKILTDPRFSAPTRRSGQRAVIAGILVSLAANMGMGIIHGNAGEILMGILVVGGALWAERTMSKISLKAARPARKPAARSATPKATGRTRTAAAKTAPKPRPRKPATASK